MIKKNIFKNLSFISFNHLNSLNDKPSQFSPYPLRFLCVLCVLCGKKINAPCGKKINALCEWDPKNPSKHPQQYLSLTSSHLSKALESSASMGNTAKPPTHH